MKKKTKKFHIIVRFWKVEFSVFYNSSLKQIQIAFGQRYFDGSAEYTKRFFVIKSSQKDIFSL